MFDRQQASVTSGPETSGRFKFRKATQRFPIQLLEGNRRVAWGHCYRFLGG